jgi:DNA-binding response OmpR family regulator
MNSATLHDAQTPPRLPLGRKKPRVLVVEDDPDMRRLVTWALRGEGYDVVEACDGTAFLTIQSAASNGECDAPDVVVSDIKMPDLSAFEVLAALRRRAVATPVVLMTAFVSEQTFAEARALGAVDVLPKPLDWLRLRATVQRVLCRR